VDGDSRGGGGGHGNLVRHGALNWRRACVADLHGLRPRTAVDGYLRLVGGDAAGPDHLRRYAHGRLAAVGQDRGHSGGGNQARCNESAKRHGVFTMLGARHAGHNDTRLTHEPTRADNSGQYPPLRDPRALGCTNLRGTIEGLKCADSPAHTVRVRQRPPAPWLRRGEHSALRHAERGTRHIGTQHRTEHKPAAHRHFQ
jgi:hypothetical protein